MASLIFWTVSGEKNVWEILNKLSFTTISPPFVKPSDELRISQVIKLQDQNQINQTKKTVHETPAQPVLGR